MGIDYYRCKKCDIQMADATGGYDWCNGCSAVICYTCAWKLKIRKKIIDWDTPGEPIQGKFKMEKIIEDKKHPEDYYHMLTNCPYCAKKDKAKEDADLLKFLLKYTHLTRSKAIKVMNSGKKS